MNFYNSLKEKLNNKLHNLNYIDGNLFKQKSNNDTETGLFKERKTNYNDYLTSSNKEDYIRAIILEEGSNFTTLNNIYNNCMNEIFKNYMIDKRNELIKLKEAISNILQFDKYKDLFINDIDEKIDNVDWYTYSDNNKNDENNEEYDDIDPLLMEAIDFTIKTGQASVSFIQQKFKIGYARAGRIIDQMEERGIISGYAGSNPRRVLITKDKWNSLNNENTNKDIKLNNIRRLSDKEYNDLEEYKKRLTMTDEEIIKLYGIEVDYNNKNNTDLIHSCLITNSHSDEPKTEILQYITKYYEAKNVKVVLLGINSLCFNNYNGLPNLLIPVVNDFRKAQGALAWAKQEIDDRYATFIRNNVKNIVEYNKKSNKMEIDYNNSNSMKLEHTNLNTSENLVYIVVIIDEVYDILKLKESNDILLNALLNGENAGIKFILFSKFSKKNLNLGNVEDILEIYDNYSLTDIIDHSNLDNNDVSDEIKKIDTDMDGFEFEKYTGKLLEGNGFNKVQITQCSGDFGVDVIAFKDDIKYAIQCKKYSSPVGIKAVQEVIGSKSMNDCHVAVVLTNNYFTPSATALAHKNNVLLWDRKKLIELIDKIKKDDLRE